ncbi:MAG: hypothetical protein MZU79_07220 [Anaerotruncus sp.]|nr:hypothetical protein [Anaerotruncus sp.]
MDEAGGRDSAPLGAGRRSGPGGGRAEASSGLQRDDLGRHATSLPCPAVRSESIQ